MTDEAALAVAMRDIEACMRLIVSRRGSAYWAAWRVWDTAMRSGLRNHHVAPVAHLGRVDGLG